MSTKVLIGIDPGVHTGICIYDRPRGDIVKLCTLDFWGAVDMIREYAGIVSTAVYLEDPAANRPVFCRPGVDGRTLSKVAQNVGSNKRDAQLLADLCTHIKITCHKVRPTSRSMTKLTPEQFAKITGWEKRTSSHARDAAMLVWGVR